MTRTPSAWARLNLHGLPCARTDLLRFGRGHRLPPTCYFYTVLFHAIRASEQIAIERGETFKGFEKSEVRQR